MSKHIAQVSINARIDWVGKCQIRRYSTVFHIPANLSNRLLKLHVKYNP